MKNSKIQKKLEIILGILMIIFLLISGINIFITKKENEFLKVIKKIENIQSFSINVQRIQGEMEISLEGEANIEENSFSLTKGGINTGVDLVKLIYKQQEKKIDYEAILNNKKIYETSILDIYDLNDLNVNVLPQYLIELLKEDNLEKVSEGEYQKEISTIDWLRFEELFKIFYGTTLDVDLNETCTITISIQNDKITTVKLTEENNQLNISIEY